jgi:hypothetical protein
MPEIFHPNSGFFISGSDLETTNRLKWGDVNISLDRLLHQGATGVSGALTPDIQTSEVFVIDADGSAVNLGEQIVRLKEVDKVSVNTVSPTFGKPGMRLTVNGSNFYRITNVRFGGTESVFETISPTEIQASVPVDARHGKVEVHSSTRSGEAGTTYNTASSPNYFSPRPQIRSISRKSSPPGDVLTIEGYSLSSVDGVKFLPSDDVILPFNVTNTSLKVTVPHGPARGSLVLLAGSDLRVTGQGPDSRFTHSTVVSSIVPSGALAGGDITLNGTNFYSGTLSYTSGDFVKVNFGGIDSTGVFKLVSTEKITGTIPLGVPTGENWVSLYSDAAEIYPSGNTVTVSGQAPAISSFSPLHGVTGTKVSIVGENLIGIRKITLTDESDSTNSFSVTGSGISTKSKGKGLIASSLQNRMEVEIPTGFQSGYSSGEGRIYLKAQVSGDFGTSNALRSGFLVVGRPIIESVVGGASFVREPSSTGSLSGLNLLKNAKIKIYDSVTAEGLGFVMSSGTEMDTSSGQFVKNLFKFPPSFSATGIKLKVSSLGGESNLSETIPVYKKPTFSGFTPLSGEAGTAVFASGYFSGLKPSGVLLDGVVTKDIAFSGGSTGISFLVPSGANSEFFKVVTSGGSHESKNKFSLMPDKPDLTGLSPSFSSPLSYSVFGEGQRLDIFGRNLNLVDEVVFFDQAGGDVSQTVFASKSANRISLSLPANAYSGVMRSKDRFNRMTTGTSAFNIAEFSGASGYYAKFEEDISFSGKYFSGLNATFQDEFLSGVSGIYQSTSEESDNGFTFTTRVPRDIVPSRIKFSGNNNDSIFITDETFFPLPTITGVSGSSSDNGLTLNSSIRVSGVNSYGGYQSGDAVIGITGDGKHSFLPVNSFSRVTGSDGAKSSVFGLSVSGGFTGSGQLFIMSPWEDYKSPDFVFPSSKTSEYLSSIVTDNYYTIVYPAPSISGLANTDVAYSSSPTGRMFNERISGWISGNNLSPVTGVFFSGYTGSPALQGAADFVALSNNLIQFASPFGSYGATGSAGITGSGDIIIKSPEGDATTAGMSQSGAFLIPPISVDVFLPQEGTTGSVINLHDHVVPNGTLEYLSEISFEAENYTGSASVTVHSSSYATTTVPTVSLLEGRDVTLKAHGLLTDQVIVNNTGVGLVGVDDDVSVYRPYRFRVIPDTPAVQFNVLSGRGAPETGPSRSSMFTIVENIDGVDYYVTKIINPDGREIIMNTEKV